VSCRTLQGDEGDGDGASSERCREVARCGLTFPFAAAAAMAAAAWKNRRQRDRSMLRAQSYGDYLAQIWRFRYFWLSLVVLDLRAKYRRSALGIGWSLLHPIAMATVLSFVFHKVFQQNIREYLPFVLTGVGTWSFITAAALEGCQSIFAAEKYIRSTPLPMAIYPLRAVLGVTFHFLIVLGMALVVTGFCVGYENPLALFALAPTLLLLFLFAWSLATILGFINVYFPDTANLVQIGLQALYFLTPVFYPMEILKGRLMGKIIEYNPLGALLGLIRDPILFGRVPSADSYLAASATVAIAVGGALWMLSHNEKKLIFYL
jgi:lipopolysaccharide transport system permease protein